MTTHTIENGRYPLEVDFDDFSPPWIYDKTPILLQHGFGRAASIWTTWMSHLTEHYPVIRPNLRGLRERPVDFQQSDLSMNAYLSDLCRILDEREIDQVHYCGESFGGCIGMAFASRHPKRVKSLSIVASPVFLNQKWHDNYSMGHGSWSKAMEALGIPAWLDETNRSTRFPASICKPFIDWYKSLVEGSDPEVLIGMARMIETTDIRPYLPGIEAPTLLLSPMGGGIMTEEQFEAYRAGVKRLSIMKFDTQFHKIQLLRAAQCAAHVLHFCSLADGRALLDF